MFGCFGLAQDIVHCRAHFKESYSSIEHEVNPWLSESQVRAALLHGVSYQL
jgi:hypothetical protein